MEYLFRLDTQPIPPSQPSQTEVVLAAVSQAVVVAPELRTMKLIHALVQQQPMSQQIRSPGHGKCAAFSVLPAEIKRQVRVLHPAHSYQY